MASFTRRTLLVSTARVGAAGLVTTLVAACGLAPRPSTTPTTVSSAASYGKVKLPTYVAFQGGPAADLPGRADGVDAGYFNFPTTLFKSVKEAPGKGEDVSLMTNVIQGAVVPLEQNAAWQAVNQDMGLTVRQRLYGQADYRTGLNTTIAGGNLPDTLYNSPANLIGNLPTFLRSQCADLTPYLSGDAVKDYPNLANIPTPCWAETVFNGAIYAVPVPRAPFLNALLVRQDLVDQAKLEPPKSADDFKKYLMALTRPQQNQFGLGSATPPAFGMGSQSPLLMVFGAPNNWALSSNGKLIKDYETDEFKAAVGFARELWAAGAYHPDTRTLTGTTLSTALRGGQAAVAIHSFGALIAQWPILAAENSSARLRVLHPFSADGKTRPIYHTGPSNFGMSFVKKGSPERAKLLLRVLNYIAAPFGSQEWALLNYGVEGVHYTRDASGVPVLTEKGKTEVLSTWKYITNNPQVLFTPFRSKEYATNIQEDEKALADAAIADPTLGLFSATYSAQKVSLDQAMSDGIADIVVGRNPLSDIDGLVNDWRNNGGEKARGEYLEAITANK
jgi:putative aldouronate transport system substrate-binding protein